MSRRRCPLPTFPAALLALAGCSTPDALCLRPSALDTVTIETSADANRDNAVALDIVYARTPPLAERLRQLPAREWFAQRRQFERDWQGDLVVRSWELAPDQQVIDQQLDPPCSVDATLAFAGYPDDGPHRLALDGLRLATLQLGRDEAVLAPAR